MEKETKEKLDRMFPHFAGYDEIRLEMAELIDMVQNHELYARKGIHYPRGWLLYGDPGTGKTRLVRDIVRYLNIPCVEISASQAVWKKRSNEEEVRQGFEEAKKYDLAILFIDELEKLAGYRARQYEVPENLKSQKVLLHELDNVYEKDGIIVMATCNRLDYLGEALSRSGRFDRQIRFNKPYIEDRKAILAHFLSKVSLEEGVTLDELARMTLNCSGADLETIVNEASIKSVSERREAISINDFSYALDRVQLDDVPRTSISDAEKKITAIHEAGHAYIAYRLMRENVGSVTVIHQGATSGATRLLQGKEEEATSLQDLKDSCTVGLGGLASVKVITGEPYCGNVSDLESVCKMAERMLNEGFYGPKYVPVSKSSYSFGPYSINLANAIQEKGSEIVQELINRAESIIQEGKESVLALANALMEKSSLLSAEVLQILEEAEKKRLGELGKDNPTE